MEEINLKLLEELSNSFGPSGFELEIQRKLKNYVKTFSKSILQDKTGTLIFTAEGEVKEPKIMIAGHVDEIGFQVSAITKEGYRLCFLRG
ncbi:MAG: hypothetical protein ACTSRO_12500 [Candidatus Heimdallarchaeaceae archaeon]